MLPCARPREVESGCLGGWVVVVNCTALLVHWGLSHPKRLLDDLVILSLECLYETQGQKKSFLQCGRKNPTKSLQVFPFSVNVFVPKVVDL